MAKIIAQAQRTITEINETFTVKLTNEVIAIPCYDSGVLKDNALSGASTIVEVFQGNVKLESANISIGNLINSTGTTSTKTANTIKIIGITQDSGYVDIPVSYTKIGQPNIYLGTYRFTYVKQRDGISYTIVLTNEAHVISCENNGVPISGEIGSSGKAFSHIVVYKGSVKLTAVSEGTTPGNNEFKYIIDSASTKGCTASRTDNDTFYINTVSADSGSIGININIENKQTVSKMMSFTKSKKGADGKPGANGSNGATGPVGPIGPPGPILDWVKDWDSGKVTIGDTKVLAPRIFAGTVSSGKPTGVALGQNVFGTLNGFSGVSGLAGYKNGVKTYHLTTDGNFLVGQESGAHMKFDGSNFVLRADKISIGSVNVATEEDVNKTVRSVDVEYAMNDSSTVAPTTGWQTKPPTWQNGKFIWSRTTTRLMSGSSSTTTPVCITGAKGDSGPQGATGSAGKGVQYATVTYQASSSGTTVPTGTWSATIPSVAANQYLWTRTIFTYTDGSSSTAYSIGKMGATGATGATGSQGPAGASARYVIVTGEQAFRYTSNFSGVPTPTSIRLTATIVGTSGYQWSYRTPGSTTVTNISGATSSTYDVTYNNSIWGSHKQLTFRCTSSGQFDEITIIKVSDGAQGDKGSTGATGATGAAGKDAYTVILTNESHTFPGGTSSALSGSTRCEVIAYKGATRVAVSIGTITGLPTGMTAPISYNGTTSAYFSPTVTTSMSTTGGVLTIPITVDGQSFKKNFTYSLALKGSTGSTGATGATGNGIRSSSVTYQASTSGTSVPGGTWYTSIPSVAANQYLWTRTIFTFTNGSTSTAYSVGKMGATGATGSQGATGATGQGVSSITEEYYLSTSKTSQSGGYWTTTPPTWSTGKYVWTRSKITYKNPTTTAYTTPVCDSSWEAVNEVEVGGRNYILGGKGDEKVGFFKNFDRIVDGYGEHTLTSKKTYSAIYITDGFLLSARDYEVGREITFSYEIMYTAWDFPTGTNRAEFWIGQRYSGSTSQSSDGAWRPVTSHNLPVVGAEGCELNKWFKVERTMVVPPQAHPSILDSGAIQFYNSNSSVSASITFRMRNVKIEYGNKATDWTPAPEDTQDEIENAIGGVVSGTQAAIKATQDEIMNFIKDSDFANSSDVQSQINTLSSNFEQIKEGFKMDFGGVEKSYTEINGVITKFISDFKSNILFSAEGITLGRSDSSFKSILSNTKLAFKQGEVEVASISGYKMNITSAEIYDELILSSNKTRSKGAFILSTDETTGNMRIKWIAK